MTTKQTPAIDENLLNATAEFIARQERTAHPEGKFDNGGRWYPNEETEKCECCNYIRRPSRAFPFSMMVHCRTAEHIANLYNVNAKDIKALAKLSFLGTENE